MSLHHAQELDDDFRAGSDEDLAFSGFLGVVDGIERIVQDAGFDHGGWRIEILSSWERDEVSTVREEVLVLAIRNFERKECPVKGSSAHDGCGAAGLASTLSH